MRAAGPGVPVIASLNGVSPGGWTSYATAMQDAGAAAIELNIYYLPGDPLIPARDAERRYTEILLAVKAAVRIPVAVKIGPYFSSPGEMATVLDQAGADGLVLFNRFLQTDIDPETFTVSTGFRLSSPGEASLPRSWIRLLHGKVRLLAGGDDRGGDVDRRRGVPAGRRGRGDDHLRAAAARPRLRHRADQRAGGRGCTARASPPWPTLRGLLSAKDGLAEPGRPGYLSAIEQATHAYGGSEVVS